MRFNITSLAACFTKNCILLFFSVVFLKECVEESQKDLLVVIDGLKVKTVLNRGCLKGYNAAFMCCKQSSHGSITGFIVVKALS